MTTDVISVSPGHGVRHIAALMMRHCISAVPVIDDGGKLVGIVSEGDLMQRSETGACSSWWLDAVDRPADRLHRYIRSRGTLAHEVMSTNVVTVTDTASVAFIARLLVEKGIKRVPVIRDAKVVGIVSRADVLRAVAAAPGDRSAAGDEAIRIAIVARMRDEARLSTDLLNVSVSGGLVRLSGNVGSELEKDAARVAAWSVRGVQGVVDELEINETRGQAALSVSGPPA